MDALKARKAPTEKNIIVSIDSLLSSFFPCDKIRNWRSVTVLVFEFQIWCLCLHIMFLFTFGWLTNIFLMRTDQGTKRCPWWQGRGLLSLELYRAGQGPVPRAVRLGEGGWVEFKSGKGPLLLHGQGAQERALPLQLRDGGQDRRPSHASTVRMLLMRDQCIIEKQMVLLITSEPLKLEFWPLLKSLIKSPNLNSFTLFLKLITLFNGSQS